MGTRDEFVIQLEIVEQFFGAHRPLGWHLAVLLDEPAHIGVGGAIGIDGKSGNRFFGNINKGVFFLGRVFVARAGNFADARKIVSGGVEGSDCKH